ncbi:hypothetical protein L0337_28655 [candidate division KSB1 bacterium]|nr:hypothetical protein [candidate division KSB1 bacterium]
MRVLNVRSLGSLSHLFLLHFTKNALLSMHNSDLLNSIELISEQYDVEIMPSGPGSFRRAGIIAIAEPL